MHDEIATDRYYSCIDVGTNSIKLLVADLANGHALPVFELSATTRIGEGLDASNRRLREIPMRRTLEALAGFVHAASEYPIRAMACVGTAALRDAENAPDFVNRAKDQLGISIEVISGQEEARLSFLAVRRDPHWRNVHHLRVIDVGGGSTELVEGAPGSESIQSRQSINLGAVKLTERYLKSDPPTIDQLTSAANAIKSEFSRLQISPSNPMNPDPPACLVGVGGTLTTLAAMCIGGVKDAARIHGYRLTTEDLELQITRISRMTIAQRTEIQGLDPRRADIILGGALLVSYAMSCVGSNEMGISTRGLRWGVLYDRFGAS